MQLCNSVRTSLQKSTNKKVKVCVMVKHTEPYSPNQFMSKS
uniref:Uncharacterized protein n=1 Tax=Arundo donax TaxID=35708 RepID=A0A0A9CD01_ARUDO